MYKKLKLSIPIIVAILSGCANLPRAELPAGDVKTLQSINLPKRDVVGDSDTLSVNIGGQDMFVSWPLDADHGRDEIPDIEVPAFSVSNETLYTFMRVVLDGHNIPFSIDGEHSGANVERRFVTATNVSGSLKSILETFSNSIGFDYYFSAGVLHLTQDRQYIAKIPPVNDIFTSLPPMLKTLGATDVFIDKTSRSITYRASKPSQSKVVSYLKWIRDNKKLIIYKTYIAEVVLNDSTNTGIAWNNMSWAGSAGKTPISIASGGVAGAASAAAGSVGLGAVFTGSHFSMNVLASFLKSQGTVNQISQIPMMLVAGGQTSFHNGGTDYYVSSIGAPTITATGQTIQGQSLLSPLVTGIDLSLTGDVYEDTVFTDISMSMVSLTGYATFPAGAGQSMQAPITTDRKISTSVRVRPGDTILIAGINYETTSSSMAGIPGMKGGVALPTSLMHSGQRSELVIVMRPEVIDFRREADAEVKKDALK